MAIIEYFIVISLTTLVYCNIDLYIAQKEVQRILGFQGELYYIRDGETNRNAIKYHLMVPENTNYVKLTWRDKKGFTLAPTFYTAMINTSESLLSSVNMSLKTGGHIPSEEAKEFYLNMKCKEHVGGSALVNFYLRITTSTDLGQSIYNLVFTFKKMCDAGDALPTSVSTTVPKEQNSGIETSVKKSKNKTSMFYIAVGVTCSIILVIGIVVAYLHVRSMKKAKEEVISEFNTIAETEATAPPVKTAAQAVRMVRAEQQLKEMLINLKDFSIRRNLLTIGNAVQEGSFGRIYIGTLISAESGEEFKVTVKTVTDHASPEQVAIFLAEASQLKRTTHHNILPLMHVCCEGQTPLIIYPYMNRGNLKNYLRLSRTVEPLSRPLTTRDIVTMALQVARGLFYLSRHRIVYKDVATRNCVVDEELHVKVCDNALARDFFPGDYHCFGENENRPVRWMAVESLELNEYSPASDVWSFGVLLWELCSLAQTPYASVDPLEMLSYLQSGLRLPQPANCPDDFFTVMACCWALSSDERPHFQQITACLDAFISKLNAFI